MNVTAIKTQALYPDNAPSIFEVLYNAITSLEDGVVVAVTSKIVSICEGNVVKKTEVDLDELIRSEADLYIPKVQSKYDVTLTIKDSIIAPSSGIDASNGNGWYILWPKDPQESANKIREYLCEKFSLTNVGVIITDSKTTPLRWGTSGVALSHSGFLALKDYVDTEDIFGRILQFTKSAVADSLANAAVLIMGEGNEQTPIAIIRDVPFVEFQNRNPTQQELQNWEIDIEDDIYSPILTSAPWKKGDSHLDSKPNNRGE